MIYWRKVEFMSIWEVIELYCNAYGNEEVGGGGGGGWSCSNFNQTKLDSFGCYQFH